MAGQFNQCPRRWRHHHRHHRGRYAGESGWSDTSGSNSIIESTPSYQANISDRLRPQRTRRLLHRRSQHWFRPSTAPSPIRDMFGWQVVGGASAALPWAALVAIADLKAHRPLRQGARSTAPPKPFPRSTASTTAPEPMPPASTMSARSLPIQRRRYRRLRSGHRPRHTQGQRHRRFTCRQ